VREAQRLDEIVAEAGGAHAGALTTLRAPDRR
jgi:diaminopimelate decarboxylase